MDLHGEDLNEYGMSVMWNLWHGCPRVCDYDWVLNIREKCINSNVSFHFKQTGAHFLKDGRLYNIPRNQQMAQANRARIDFKL